MIHADEIDACILTQVTRLRTAASVSSLDSYYENLGICPDCLLACALALCHPGSNEVTPTASFASGVAVGMILGREHAA